jgi:outer membrane protein assembly factor BamA
MACSASPPVPCLPTCPFERGDRVDASTAAQTIRALFRTGFFSDVKLDQQDGGILVVTVVERPAINKITLTGNKDIKSEELIKGLNDIGLAEGETFNQLALDRVTQELTRQYNNRGKYNVSISPSIANLDRNRVDIVIDVKEGKAARIDLLGERHPDTLQSIASVASVLGFLGDPGEALGLVDRVVEIRPFGFG